MKAHPAIRFSVAIVGAGVHGVHHALRLSESKKIGRVAVIDPHTEPLTAWQTRTRNCTMEFLRSPASHGVSPQLYALRQFAERQYDGQRWHDPPYHRPATDVFAHNARVQLAKLSTDRFSFVRGRVEVVHRENDHFVLTLGDDQQIQSEAVILAPGQPRPNIPKSFERYAPPMVDHIHRLGFDPTPPSPGSSVLFLGGGIAAAHLILRFARSPVSLTWWRRDRNSIHQFDADPCFIGPRCQTAFPEIADYSDRRTLITRSRRPGSVPSDLAVRLENLIQRGKIAVARIDSSFARRAGGRIAVVGQAKNRRIKEEFDRLILCTGFRREVPAIDLVERITAELNAPTSADGFPVPRRDLSWVDGLYLSGGLAELELGPPARNIIGAHLAGRRITPSLLRYLQAGQSV